MGNTNLFINVMVNKKKLTLNVYEKSKCINYLLLILLKK